MKIHIIEGINVMITYEEPSAELLLFDNDIVLSEASGTCRCYADAGVKFDYSALESNCWTDSVDATEIMMHDGL